MITRAMIIEEIQKVPDEFLDELYQTIKGLKAKIAEPENPIIEGPSVMEKLRQIKISAPPDFSTKATLYPFKPDIDKSEGN